MTYFGRLQLMSAVMMACSYSGQSVHLGFVVGMLARELGSFMYMHYCTEKRHWVCWLSRKILGYCSKTSHCSFLPV